MPPKGSGAKGEADRARAELLERRRNERCRALITATLHPDNDAPRDVAQRVTQELADQLLAMATQISTDRKTGHVVAAREATTAGHLVAGIARELGAWTPATAPPERPDIAVDNRAGTVTDLDRRLNDAFGPEVAPNVVAHIALNAPQATYCAVTTGVRGNRNAANCANCIDAWNHRQTDLPDGPITSDVARQIRERVESEVDGRPTPTGVDVVTELADPAWQPKCDNGPTCPVHPGVKVNHPDHLPTDAVIGPEGGAEIIPDEYKIAPEVVATLLDNPRNLGTPGVAGEHPSVAAFPVPVDPPDPSDDPQPVTLSVQRDGWNGDTNMSSLMPTPTEPAALPPVRPRLTFAQVIERRNATPDPDHRSVSQIHAAQECGVKFALYREPGVPAWWNVSGTALHRAIEMIELMIAEIPHDQRWWDSSAFMAAIDAEGMWRLVFPAQIDEERKSSGVSSAHWRAARGGSENYDWWRINGEGYLTAYITWRVERAKAGWHMWRLADGKPAVEVPFSLDVSGIRVDGVIDQIWSMHPSGAPDMEIIDLKFGSSLPVDHFQTGVYAWWLARRMTTTPPPIGAAFYAGRRSCNKGPGEALHNRVTSVLDVVPWDVVVWQTWQADQLDKARLYLPHRTNMCSACSVFDLCPVGAS